MDQNKALSIKNHILKVCQPFNPCWVSCKIVLEINYMLKREVGYVYCFFCYMYFSPPSLCFFVVATAAVNIAVIALMFISESVYKNEFMQELHL